MNKITAHHSRDNHAAFTMLELVFVIIVIGILAAMSVSRVERDLRQEAADNILSDIRYTQHLALTDNKQRLDQPTWERAYWHIVFGTCQDTDRYYMIGSDRDLGGSNNAYFDENESAIDPVNGKPMFWRNGQDCSDINETYSDRIFITKKYGIVSIDSSGGCGSARHIAFDHIGRPYHGVGFSNANAPRHAGYMSEDCIFTFTMSTDQDNDGAQDNFKIQINSETGYAFIKDQNRS